MVPLVQKSSSPSSADDIRWFSIYDKIKDGSFAFFERAEPDYSLETGLKHPLFIKTEKKNYTFGKNYSTKKILFSKIVEQFDRKK